MALKGIWQRTTVLDRLVVLVLGLICLASFAVLGRAGAGQRVVIIQDGKARYTAPLNIDRTIRLEGPLGDTVVAIGKGEVCVLESPCPHKICIGSGAIARTGEVLACVPNRLLIRIEGQVEEKDGGYDLLSR